MARLRDRVLQNLFPNLGERMSEFVRSFLPPLSSLLPKRFAVLCTQPPYFYYQRTPPWAYLPSAVPSKRFLSHLRISPG